MKLFFSFCFLLFLSSCAITTVSNEQVNGLSYVASREAIDTTHIKPVIDMHANYASIMPFGFLKNIEHPEIVFDNENQWFGETKGGSKQYIEALKNHDIKIMLKPQIWVWKGEFTGTIEMTSEEDWKLLETTYSTFIIEFAELAEELNVEIFCIGTELEKFVENRPSYWKNLIQDIRAVYTGKLTYAANWDEFKRTPFWDVLDFIGIDAYFPVSEEKTPTVEECKSNWNTHKLAIKSVVIEYDKPVLFTEFGYRSVDYSGKEPWKSDRNMSEVNLVAQTNTTQALFETFWNEPWFSGGFVWKWHHNYEHVGGIENTQFTPQNKPVAEVIKKIYASY